MSPAQPVGMAVGIWLVAAPAVLGYAGTPADDVHRVVGPLAASAALIAIWEATRGVRLLNLVLAAGLLVAPLVAGHPPAATVNALACGAVLLGVTPFGGRSSQSMGGGWRSLARSSPPRQERSNR